MKPLVFVQSFLLTQADFAWAIILELLNQASQLALP